jgi:hypothetical protein
MTNAISIARVSRNSLIAALFAICCVVAARAGSSSKPSSAELAAITARGRMLAEYDAAAWQATDAVMATHPKSEPSGRYIGHKTEAGWVVDFGYLNGDGDKFLVNYEATQAGAKFEVKSFNPERQDTGWNLSAARGMKIALADFSGADHPYNIAVLPAEGESLYVYLYPAQVKAGVYPLGADARYRLSPDGMKIVDKRQMHKSIIESAPASTDVKVASGYHTHILSDVPEDTDVMLVLTRQPRVPEIVLTPSYMYTIGVDGKITVEDRPKP